MKRTLKIGGRLALVGAGLGVAYWQLQGRFNPQARYRVERRQGSFEIRVYEPAVRAETAIVATDWDEALRTGFERLAYYIHEGNSERERIAMTGPVTQSAERVSVATPAIHQAPSLPNGMVASGTLSNGVLPGGELDEHEPPATAPRAPERALGLIEHVPSVPSWIMSFAMPPGRHLRELPAPDDPRVRLLPMSERHVAVLRFSGRYTPLRVGDRARELIHRVHREGLEPRGPVEFAGYDPPTTLPFLRRNEVRVELAA
jgi:hypothetical protein